MFGGWEQLTQASFSYHLSILRTYEESFTLQRVLLC